MAKKTKVDTIKGSVEMQNRLKTKIESPVELTEAESVVFDEVIKGLPVELWGEYRIRLAVMLCRLTVVAENLMADIVMEGPMVRGRTGFPVTNPKQNSLVQCTSTIQSLTKTLGLSASQRGVSDTSSKAVRQAEDEARNAINSAKNSGGLLA